MDIASFLSEPNPTNEPVFVQAAYRPIYFLVEADSVVTYDQPMYADIYMDGTFYKTLSSYPMPTTASGTNGVYEFDLQDAYQEYLQTYIAPFPVMGITQTNATDTFSSVDTVVYFRGSSITAGILTPNPVIPVQATASTPAVAGTGTPCYPFTVVNASILPYFRDEVGTAISIIENNYETFLDFNRVTAGLVMSGIRVYPLSNMPKNQYNGTYLGTLSLAPTVYATDNGSFPIAILEYGISGVLNRYTRNLMLVLIYTDSSGTVFVYPLPTTAASVTNGLYYIPIGIADLAAIDPLTTPLLLTANANVYYRIGVYDIDALSYEFISPMYKAGNKAIESETLYFQNSNGHMEMLGFVRSSTKHNTTSSDQFKPYTANAATYDSYTGKQQLGHKRYNVRASDELMLSATFSEALMPWVRDLFDSPFIMQRMPEYGKAPYTKGHILRAVRLLDEPQFIVKSVVDGMRTYEVSIKIRPSLDYITLRN